MSDDKEKQGRFSVVLDAWRKAPLAAVLEAVQPLPKPPLALDTEVEFTAKFFANLLGATLQSPLRVLREFERLSELGEIEQSFAAWLTLTVFQLSEPASVGLRMNVANDVLSKEVDAPPGAAEALANAIGLSLSGFCTSFPKPRFADGDSGILALDAEFASFVETIGRAGDNLAKAVRENGAERRARYDDGKLDVRGLWHLWSVADGAPRAITLLTEVLWFDVVRLKLESDELARRKPAAITHTVSSHVLDLCSQRYEITKRDGQQKLEFPNQSGWAIVPSVDDDVLANILERGLGHLTSQVGIDLIEWEITEAHRQHLANNPDFRVLVVDGGFSALARDKLGFKSKRAAESVRNCVYAQAHLRWKSTFMKGNLISYNEPEEAAPGRRSRVEITVGNMLVCGFAQAIREKHGATSIASRDARRLVPILGKTALIGRGNDCAAQRRLTYRLSMHLRENAEELARHGSIAIPLDRWATLASEAGAPRSGGFISRVLGALENGDTKVEPLIVRVKGERDRFTLHESRKSALDFIVEGGRLTTAGRKGGKASARKRAAGGASRKLPT